jgi:hypothetical protein
MESPFVECEEQFLERYFGDEEGVVPSTPPSSLDTEECVVPSTPPSISPSLRPDNVYWPNADANMEEALMTASNLAYVRFFNAIETARLRQQSTVRLQDPVTYQVGRFEFHWSVFVHGLRVKGRRNRSHWTKRGLLVPFEQLRRTFAKQGLYVILNHEEGAPVVRVFTQADIHGNPDFTVSDVNGRAVYIYRETEGRNFYNVVPF